MTDIEQKALKLLNEVSLYKCENVDTAPHEDLCVAFRRAIEQHEAFRQEVSDELIKQGFINASTGIGRFITPAAKPDPLREIAEAWGLHNTVAKSWVEDLRATLEARGFEIREKNDG